MMQCGAAFNGYVMPANQYERDEEHVRQQCDTSSFDKTPSTYVYTVGQKTAPLYFCTNFVKTFRSEIIIGTYILIRSERSHCIQCSVVKMIEQNDRTRIRPIQELSCHC